MKVVAAVGELEEVYGDRIDFVVVPAEETMQPQAQSEIDAFGFTDLKHGLVVFDPEGVPAVKMPGHAFGREEIETAIETVLGAN